MITVPATKPPTYYGKSTDVKPTGLKGGNGSKFKEIDTHAEFFYDEEDDQWCGAPEPEPAAEEET